MSSVTIAGKEYPVVLPTSFTKQSELMHARIHIRSAPARASGAMIGLCVAGASDVALKDCDWDLMVYGERVVDQLAEKGVGWPDIQAATLAIMGELNRSLKSISLEAVGDAADFTEAPEDGTQPSS